MRNLLGYVLWLAAIAITVIVVGAKFNLFQVPVATAMLHKDDASSLLVAIALSLVAKWV